MKTRILISIICLFATISQVAGQENAVVPHLVKFGGHLNDIQGRPMSGITGVTFSIYRSQDGGAPLWTETQNIKTDIKGQYVTLLGSTKAEGVPVEMFVSGEAQWLGVRPDGQSEQPRILLVSVPYALKAIDAQTLGGIPASAFLRVGPQQTTVGHQDRQFSVSSSTTLNNSVMPDSPPTSIPWSNSILSNDQNGDIELGTPGTGANPTSGATPYIDFHFGNGKSQDYNIRVINSADNQLQIDSASAGTMAQFGPSNVQINYGVANGGTGIKHVRSTATCTTGNNQGNSCSLTINWPGAPFSDTNYTVVCSPNNYLGSPYSASWLYVPANQKTTSSFVVSIETLNSQTTTLTGVYCIGIHD